MSTCILHVSDLHFGARNGLDDPVLEQAVGALIESARPALVVATGDLTHRCRPSEHEAAARYLHELGVPLLVVPGNHDIPLFPPGRFTHPLREFERNWGTDDVHSSPELLVVGLSSITPWGHQRGRVLSGDLERAETRLRSVEPGVLRVVALHHQLAGAPWRSRKRPVSGRSKLLDRLAGAGAELILGGHVHQATIAERREFEVVGGDGHTCVLATAPGLGRPRPRRRNEAQGVLVHRADETEIAVETHVWREGAWAPTGARRFSRMPPRRTPSALDEAP
ncbi:MAG TPA: metallophosphoesterase [Gaiellaceae bacterium]|nr:metallophosphoesterase [Gaiellaceae bacterium]